MNSHSAWIQLVEALQARTREGRLKWSATTVGDLSSISARLSGARQVFAAKADKSAYEISAGDLFNRAPYELKVWEGRDQRKKPLVVIESSLEFAGSPEQFMLNQALQNLFETVDGSVESDVDIVGRLIQDLDSLGPG